MAIVNHQRPALAVPFAMHSAGPCAEGALLRPGVLPDRDRAALDPGLADGVPARGDPGRVRLRRVRDPRPVDRRRAHRGRGSAGVPERVPPPGCQGRARAAAPARPASPAPSTAGATARTARTPRSPGAGRSASTTCIPRISIWSRCAARRGAAARGSTSTTPLRRCASASSRSPPTWTPGSWSRCAPSGGTPAGCR